MRPAKRFSSAGHAGQAVPGACPRAMRLPWLSWRTSWRLRSLAAMLFCVALAMRTLDACVVLAQTTTAWPVPESPLSVDLSAENRDVRVALTAAGMAREVRVDFFLVGRDEVELIVRLPEAGQLAVDLLNPNTLAEVRDLRQQGDRGTARIVARVPRLDADGVQRRAAQQLRKLLEPARAEAAQDAARIGKAGQQSYLRARSLVVPKMDDPLREAYLDARSLELSPPALRTALAELTARHDKWFLPAEVNLWRTATGSELVGNFLPAVEFDLVERHLHALGLEFDANQRNYDKKLGLMFQAVQAITGGKLADDLEAARKVALALDPAALAALRSRLGCSVACRWYPAVDPRDANAQWFNGQRIICQAAGIGTVRVEGKLDPAGGDRADWWLLDKLDAQRVELVFPPQAGVRHELLDVPQGPRPLRVVATTDRAASYWFELRSLGTKAPGQVQLFEAPTAPALRFPF